MGKHTPGKWFVSPNPTNWKEFQIMSNQRDTFGAATEICTLHESSIISPEQVEADARLIAAAPEMLETLEKLAAWLPEYVHSENPLRMRVEAVLAKARGES